VASDRGNRKGELLAGKYLLGDVIGAGGMGVVYEATHKELRTRCAVKVVDPSRSDSALRRRLLREARALAELTGPHAVRVLDAGCAEDGTPFFAMERLTGEPVSATMKRVGPLPWRQAVDWAWQISDAIHEAHARGIIHRDLKPSNVFVTEAGSIKVLDFGLATRTAPTADDSTATTSDFVGSPRYMSPEQIRSSVEVTPSTDVWSFGVLLFEMLSGRLPFDATSAAGVVAAIVADPPARLREVAPEVPAELDCLVADCLEKRPEDRPSILAVQTRLAELAALAHDAPPASGVVEIGDAGATLTERPLATPVSRRRNRPTRLFYGLVALAVLAILGVLVTARDGADLDATAPASVVVVEPKVIKTAASDQGDRPFSPDPATAVPGSEVPANMLPSATAARPVPAPGAPRAHPRRPSTEDVFGAIETRH
jgi:serine/threonine protein kinase